MDKAREIALKTLYKIDKEKAYSNIALDEELNKNRKILEERDIGLISEIVYGTVTWKLTIDEIIKKYSKIKLKKYSPWVLNILRMGVYQIVFLDKIPKSAAVNESVNLCKKYGPKSSGLVNAILRKVEKQDMESFEEIENDVERISKIASMPEWIVEKLIEENGMQIAERICKNSNIKPNLSIRVNKLKTTKAEIIKSLKEKNIVVVDGNLEDFIIVEKLKNIEGLSEFKEGRITLQDESAGLASIILDPKKGEYILDACSAPGGKTTYIAELMENEGKILAWDLYKHRTNLIDQNSRRLGISIIETQEKDASKFDENFANKFDKILLDVPCLGLGVIKRKPDIKWQRQETDVEEISKLQYQILDTCSKYIIDGGEIVYSTCSILKEENEDIIEKFLQNNKNFQIKNYENNQQYKDFIKQNKYIKIEPSTTNDGFFICKLIKKSSNITS